MARPASILVVATVLVVAACGAGKPGGSQPTPPTSTSVPSSAPVTAGQPATAPASVPATAAPPSVRATGPSVDYGYQFVLLARGDQLALANGPDGTVLQVLPTGVPTSDWHAVYTAAASGASTTISRVSIEGAQVERTWTLDGAWRIPTVGLGHAPAGLTGDDGRLVLVDARPAAGTSRFAVLPTRYNEAPTFITLTGRYGFDAISVDGSRLYVIEDLSGAAGTDYVVRSVTVATGSLDAGIVVDKRNVSEVMAGIPIEQRIGSDRVYTLYQGPAHPFIHMLITAERAAFCIDLPAAWGNDQANAAAWGVSLTPDGKQLYVANSRLGVLGQVDLDGVQLMRTGAFGPTASIQLAKFVGGAAGPVGSRVVLDGPRKLLYVADSNGILAISTDDLKVKARLAAGFPVASLGVAPNGRVLYAVGADGSAVRIDAATGAILQHFAGSGYTGVVRVVEPHQ